MTKQILSMDINMVFNRALNGGNTGKPKDINKGLYRGVNIV